MDEPGTSASFSIRLTHLHTGTFYSGDSIVFRQHFDRHCQKLNRDPFLFHLFDFAGDSRHLSTGTTVDNSYFLNPEASGNASSISSSVATTDDCHLRAQPHLHSGIDLLQEIQHVEDSRAILAGNSHLLAVPGAGAQKDSFIPLFEEFIKPLDGGVRLDFHPHLLYVANVAAQHLLGQSVFRNAIAQQPSRLRGSLEYCNGVSLPD